MRSLVVLLVPALAAAGTTTISVRVDDDNKVLDARLLEALRAKSGTKLDACWRTDAHVEARVDFEDGKVKHVELLESDDADAAPCIEKVLRTLTLDVKSAVAMFALEGKSAKKKGRAPQPVGLLRETNKHALDRILDNAHLDAKLAALKGSDGAPKGTSSPRSKPRRR